MTPVAEFCKIEEVMLFDAWLRTSYHQPLGLGKLFHDVSRRVVTPNGGLVRESPQYPLNSGLGIIVICPDWVNPTVKFVLQNRSQERNTSTHTIFETSKYIWVVISNMFYFHPEPWGNDPIWLAHIIQTGWEKTTNQINHARDLKKKTSKRFNSIPETQGMVYLPNYVCLRFIVNCR